MKDNPLVFFILSILFFTIVAYSIKGLVITVQKNKGDIAFINPNISKNIVQLDTKTFKFYSCVRTIKIE